MTQPIDAQEAVCRNCRSETFIESAQSGIVTPFKIKDHMLFCMAGDKTVEEQGHGSVVTRLEICGCKEHDVPRFVGDKKGHGICGVIDPARLPDPAYAIVDADFHQIVDGLVVGRF